jgi:hypothetical protein
MKCRKNIRKLIVEYNAASVAERPNTALIKLRNAIKALKSTPSRITPAQASRYDDYVYIHKQSMAGHPSTDPGPHPGHKSPMFFPWHREFLRQFELDLQAVSGDSNLTLPYWNWTKDQSMADPGFPFIDAFLGPDGDDTNSDKVMSGEFAKINGWNLNVTVPGVPDADGALRRRFGEELSGTGWSGLPSATAVRNCLGITTYDSSPWNRLSSESTSFRNTTEGWVGPSGIHNVVHVWIGGSMGPSTSPNDPVFFLHHNNIDRMWAVWMQKHPAINHYLPLDSEPTPPGVHHFVKLNDNMTDLEGYFGGTIKPSGLLDHKSIVWYDSDLPELTNETGSSLSFGGVPEGLTTYKAVRFRIKSGRRVNFRITGAPTGNFGLADGISEFHADPDDFQEFVNGYVFVQFHSVGTSGQTSAVDIEAYIVDEEGYYASAENGEYLLGTYHVNLNADVIPRQNNAVALVLDRSGSMSEPAGGSSTRSALLKDAIRVFHALLQSADELCIVSFDDITQTLQGIALQSAVNIESIISAGGLEPRGLTCIGQGILDGRTLLNTSTHTNRSMLILTDGNENVHPYVNELPPGTISSRTYAIGFGLQGQVSDEVLNQITQNTSGDLIITGNMTTSDQKFHLTKYFVQVLAGITNSNIILDPQGELFWGSIHSIPFRISDSDVSIDLIALCDAALILDFQLETPSGKIIDPSTALVEPNVKYIDESRVLCYRLMLPAIPSEGPNSHEGEWKAHLKILDKKKIVDLVRKENLKWSEFDRIKQSLPYAFIAQTYSNLQFQAAVIQKSFEPGTRIKLASTLHEYDVPFAGTSTVWVEIEQPNKIITSLTLNKTLNGQFSADYDTSLPGIYTFRFRAEGYTSKHNSFTREKTLSTSIFNTNGTNYKDDPIVGWLEGNERRWCEFLACLLSSKVITERAVKMFSDIGINIKLLRECVQKHCIPQSETIAKKMPSVPEEVVKIHELPGMKDALEIIAKQRVSVPNVGFEEIGATIPVRKAEKKMMHEDDEVFPEYPYIRPEFIKKSSKKKVKSKIKRK